MDLRLRRITGKDKDFLEDVFASALAQDIDGMQWTPEQRTTYLQHQFKAQHKAYQAKFPGGSFQIVFADGERVGRFYTNRGSDEIRVVELTLLPPFRGQGIGTQLVTELCDTAKSEGLSLGVHIPEGWRAMKLAERLGFERQLETEFSDYMLWKPDRIIAWP